MKKLAVVVTHPIQYYAPVFALLKQRQHLTLKVFYTWGQATLNKYDPGFNKQINWDIPLLEGYDYAWADNVSPSPGSHHFKGIVTPGLIKQIEAYQPHAVLVFGWAYQGHLQVMSYFKNRLPVYFRGDSTLLDERTGMRQLLRSIYLRYVYRYVDHAFYTGTNNKAYFLKYGLKARQLSFAPHAIDNKRFAKNRIQEADSLRLALAIPAQHILILFAGKLENKKSPQLLLSAFKQLEADHVHLLFAGNGELEHKLKQEATGLARVHFIDFQNQEMMPVVYQAADVFCLPSGGPGESWGLAVNEAMASGKPVVVSDKCGCAIDLVDADNGVIFKNGSKQALLNALNKLTGSKQLLAAMGKQSLNKIAGWSFDHIAQAIEQVLINEI